MESPSLRDMEAELCSLMDAVSCPVSEPPIVHVRLFHAGQRIGKDFFREAMMTPGDEPQQVPRGKRHRPSTMDGAGATQLDGKGLLELMVKDNRTEEESLLLLNLMGRQQFVAISIGLDSLGSSSVPDLASLRPALARRAIQPSGILREVATENGVARIPVSQQDMGLAIEVQFNSVEALHHGILAFRAAIAENRATRRTWYANISGCSHRYIEDSGFWKKYDVFKYDFDQPPRLHMAFHTDRPLCSLVASWPCRLKGDRLYQQFRLHTPFLSPLVETVPSGTQGPACSCVSNCQREAQSDTALTQLLPLHCIPKSYDPPMLLPLPPASSPCGRTPSVFLEELPLELQIHPEIHSSIAAFFSPLAPAVPPHLLPECNFGAFLNPSSKFGTADLVFFPNADSRCGGVV